MKEKTLKLRKNFEALGVSLLIEGSQLSFRFKDKENLKFEKPLANLLVEVKAEICEDMKSKGVSEQLINSKWVDMLAYYMEADEADIPKFEKAYIDFLNNKYKELTNMLAQMASCFMMQEVQAQIKGPDMPQSMWYRAAYDGSAWAEKGFENSAFVILDGLESRAKDQSFSA